MRTKASRKAPKGQSEDHGDQLVFPHRKTQANDRNCQERKRANREGLNAFVALPKQKSQHDTANNNTKKQNKKLQSWCANYYCYYLRTSRNYSVFLYSCFFVFNSCCCYYILPLPLPLPLPLRLPLPLLLPRPHGHGHGHCHCHSHYHYHYDHDDHHYHCSFCYYHCYDYDYFHSKTAANLWALRGVR